MDSSSTFLRVIDQECRNADFGGSWFYVGIASKCEPAFTDALEFILSHGAPSDRNVWMPSEILEILDALSVSAPNAIDQLLQSNITAPPETNFAYAWRAFLDSMDAGRRLRHTNKWSWREVRCADPNNFPGHFDSTQLIEKRLSLSDLSTCLKSDSHSGLIGSLFGSSLEFDDDVFPGLLRQAKDFKPEHWWYIIQLGRFFGRIGPGDELAWQEVVLSYIRSSGPRNVLFSMYSLLNPQWIPVHLRGTLERIRSQS